MQLKAFVSSLDGWLAGWLVGHCDNGSLVVSQWSEGQLLVGWMWVSGLVGLSVRQLAGWLVRWMVEWSCA